MYGVVEIQGHQYKVKAGDVLDVDKLTNELGSNLELNEVLFIGGENPQVGLPTVAGAKITAKVIKHDRGRKIIVFKRKPGMYQKRGGHRIHYTSLLITEVTDGAGKTEKIDANSKAAKKFL